ncbi:MAG TPA: BT4734/BF3469 family protein, partial [Flavobacterium sp.]|nr:BT4734/BF3469 family protein [Flavobacterium sp.]
MVSTYKNFITTLGDKNIIDILLDIKSGKYVSEINSIRYALHSDKVQLANGLKMDLVAFTASGTFSKQRKAKFLATYSQIINLDFDHIPTEELEGLVAKINECQYTMASFISPSGEGIKIFIKVNSISEKHSIAYNQVANFYKDLTGFDFDPKCKDITRLCFVSNDPNTYINENSNVFEVTEVAESIINIVAPQIISKLPTDDLLDKCLKFTEQKETYQNGNRNNFIYLFASNANRYGIVETDTLDFCTTNFDLDEKEITNSVTSAYKNQMADYAKFADFANKPIFQTNTGNALKSTNTEDDDSYLINTPTIPDSVYNNLPKILKEGADVFNSKREKDVFLTGALTILSGCIPNVSGVYGGRTV